MSTISVHDIQGFSTYSNTVRIPNGHKLDIDGDLVIPTHTTSGRQAGELGGDAIFFTAYIEGYSYDNPVYTLYVTPHHFIKMSW